MNRIRTSRICIICLLASFISGVTQSASGFSFGIGNSPKNDSRKDPRTTSNRPWGNIGAFKPGVQYEPPPALQAQAPPYSQAALFNQAAPYNGCLLYTSDAADDSVLV